MEGIKAEFQLLKCHENNQNEIIYDASSLIFANESLSMQVFDSISVIS